MGSAAVGASSDRVEIKAELGFPTSKAERFPAVVIAHTIGGYLDTNEGYFAAELRKAGFAADL